MLPLFSDDYVMLTFCLDHLDFLCKLEGRGNPPFYFQHPYPTEDEKKQIAAQTNLTLLQVNNW